MTALAALVALVAQRVALAIRTLGARDLLVVAMVAAGGQVLAALAALVAQRVALAIRAALGARDLPEVEAGPTPLVQAPLWAQAALAARAAVAAAAAFAVAAYPALLRSTVHAHARPERLSQSANSLARQALPGTQLGCWPHCRVPATAQLECARSSVGNLAVASALAAIAQPAAWSPS